MKRYLIPVLTVASMAACFSVIPLEAHHSFAAQYDRTKSITLEGEVTNVEWMNPHVYFYIDVADTNGAMTNWAIELGAPNGLRRRGWGKDTLKMGDAVEIDGWLSKDGAPTANASSVIGPDGNRLFSGTSNPDEAERD